MEPFHKSANGAMKITIGTVIHTEQIISSGTYSALHLDSSMHSYGSFYKVNNKMAYKVKKAIHHTAHLSMLTRTEETIPLDRSVSREKVGCL